MDLKNIAYALGGEVNRDQVLAPGPNHSPQDRSLSIKIVPESPDGFVCHSFAGDDGIQCKDYIREKLGLPAFKPNGGGASHSRPSEDAIAKALAAAVAGQQAPKLVVASYDYVDATGALLYQVVRFKPKSFSQRRPDGKGDWIWTQGERRVLYRLPELLKYPDGTVFVCEGEKDADRIASLGHCATTVAHGKWTDICVNALTGRDVLIFEDNDDTGREKALKAAQLLHGKAKTVRVVRLPGLSEGGDVSDRLDAGHSGDDLVEKAFDTPLWQPAASPSAPIALALTFTASALNGMTFDQIKFVVADFVAEGLTLFAGKPKIGKSWLLLHMAHEVAIGGYTLGGLSCEQGDVLYCALEDNQRRLQRRMLKLFNIDEWPSNLTFACEMPKLATGGIKFIKDWIGKARPRLVVIDTLAMVRSPARRDQSTYDADYAAVKELRDLAAEHDVAIIIVHHLRKADADDPFDTVSGTLGLTGCPDSIMIIWREGNGVLLAAKGRDIEEVKKSVQFDAGTCTWNVIGDADAVRRSAERSAIIKAFEEANGEPLGPRQIAEATGMKGVNVRQLIGKMKQEGMIEAASYGKYVLTTAKEV
jgi:hypothetical protein